MDSKDYSYLFKKYLNSKNIIVDENNKKINGKNVTAYMIKSQIGLIARFHNEVVGFGKYDEVSLPDEIGKTVEKYKVDIIKVKKMLSNIKFEDPQNNFEEHLLFDGDKYLDRAKLAVNIISREKYLKAIKRSMERREICIGNPYFDNLFLKGGIIIANINNCAYDLIEMDAITFFRKLRANGYKIDLDYLIHEYCKIEELDSFSEEYIMSLLSYPYYYIKCCVRYRDKKKDWNDTDYLNKLIKARRYDGGI